ncbi:hypothetical protein FO470_15295 [Starkeya sp. 3C]|uniref:Uncharacterized protein n=1 Tax=Ancylobacter moscoviensis TaxID=2597768 RepID=A0ABY3DNA8_9HYPH|nr:hypothetical protein FO470_15295 [Ancylobacter moscoviensis]
MIVSSRMDRGIWSAVIPGLGSGFHAFHRAAEVVDGRNRSGHDVVRAGRRLARAYSCPEPTRKAANAKSPNACARGSSHFGPGMREEIRRPAFPARPWPARPAP